MRYNLEVRTSLLAALVMVLTTGCVDTSTPEWFNPKTGVQITDTDGLTAAQTEQYCTPEQMAAPPDSLRLHFIDVGQGDAIWVQTPDGRNILIDAGDGGFYGRTQGATYVQAYLNENGLPPGSTFDAIAVTHAHSDHYGGLINLLSQYNTLVYVDPGHNGESISYQGVVDRAQQLTLQTTGFFRPAVGIQGLVEIKGGETNIFGPDVIGWLLHADSSLRLGDDSNAKVNNTSLVFRLSYAGKTVMLMGDAHTEVESELIARFALNDGEPKLDSNILKVGHHGSTTSSSSRFISAVFRNIPEAERYAVIQSGRVSFGGTQLPEASTIFRIGEYLDEDRKQLFSTEAGDDLKGEEAAPGDDDILAVINASGDLYVCYNRAAPAPVP